MKEEKVYLTLQNGQVYEGKRFGAEGDVLGELVFTTGMTGYIETLTDPSYYGQIVIQTFPLIGNYGMIRADAESKKPYPLGLCRARISANSLPTSAATESWTTTSQRRHRRRLRRSTRAKLTRTVREAGVMNAVISSKPRHRPLAVRALCHPRCGHSAAPARGARLRAAKTRRKVVLWDFGAKENIVARAGAPRLPRHPRARLVHGGTDPRAASRTG